MASSEESKDEDRNGNAGASRPMKAPIVLDRAYLSTLTVEERIAVIAGREDVLDFLRGKGLALEDFARWIDNSGKRNTPSRRRADKEDAEGDGEDVEGSPTKRLQLSWAKAEKSMAERQASEYKLTEILEGMAVKFVVDTEEAAIREFVKEESVTSALQMEAKVVEAGDVKTEATTPDEDEDVPQHDVAFVAPKEEGEEEKQEGKHE